MSAIDKPRVRIAVDIGGTFTDLQIVVGDAIHALKTPTTPADPSEGLFIGIREAAARFGFDLAEADLLMHGTTIATNAILERKLPDAVLVTTAGFEDVLEIGRHVRRDVYGLKPEIVPVLIPRDRRFGIAERVRADGSIERPLGGEAVGSLLRRLDEVEPACVAVCLINAFVNPAHERRLRDELAQARPRLPVSISSEVSPEIREYERTSTTVLNALLMPVVHVYIQRLQERLAAAGFAPRLFLVQSNGGVCSLGVAAEQPARLLLSGPSGGALAAERLAHETGLPNLVAVDMGGTSFDVSVVQDGRVTLITQGEIDRLPVRLPMVEIRTIGAGGGSIASVDASGRLDVGPRSAGAVPGPVCYGRGGVEPTVTDANLALGRLDAGSFLGGAISLDRDGACAALKRNIGDPLGLDGDAAAEGVLMVTNAKLASAIRLSLFEKGLDPRDFALLSFGGAGGLHAIAVAREVGIDRIVFPRHPSTLSAWGILHSDIVHDFARSRVVRLEPGQCAVLADLVSDLRAEAAALFDAERIPAADRRFTVAVDVRYVGQAFEILTPWPALQGDAALDEPALERLLADFHALHKQRFSYANPGAAVEIVTLRLTATGLVPKPETAPPRRELGEVLKAKRPVYAGGDWHKMPIYERMTMAAGSAAPGPAIIEEGYTTLFIEPGWSATMDATGNLIAEPTKADP